MTAAFDARALDRGYAYLADLPDRFLPTLVRLQFGTLRDRVEGLLRWRSRLLEGQPPPRDWPPPEVGDPVRKAFDALGLARFTRNQPELVEALLDDVLAGFVRSETEFEAEVRRQLRELEALERKRPAIEAASFDSAGPRLEDRARTMALARERQPDAPVTAEWQERVAAWDQIASVFGDLGDLLGRCWDLSQGVLKNTGWRELVRLQALVARLPALTEIVRSLGRLQTSDAAPSVAETIMGPVRRLEEERREVHTPHVATDIRGIERSGNLARMLPAEAALLGHPALRPLWYARYGERALITYRAEGVAIERTWTEREHREEQHVERPRPERGPIIAIVDTSGSMAGLPEQVAKAIVLEAVRTAHAEKRRCILFCYSGPGQVVEHELDIGTDGIGRLLDFLGLSFGGGNDEVSVLSQVLTRLEQQDWHRSDVVFVSDGVWPAPTAVRNRVESAKVGGTRFHGVQVGTRGSSGLHAVCDPVHVFSDWHEVGRRRS